MDSDSSESGDDGSYPQNGKFNEAQVKDLLTFLLKIIKILSKTLKKDSVSKERKLIKKSNGTKKAKVYHAQNEISKLCNTIKDLGSLSDNLVTSEAVAGTSGTSRSQIPAVPGTSRRHTEAISGTSRSHAEAISLTSKSHKEPALTEKSNNHIIPVMDTPRDADRTGTPKIQAPALGGNSSNHTGAAPVSLRIHNEAIPGEDRSDKEVKAVNSRRHVNPIDRASRILTIAAPIASRSHTDAFPEASRSTNAVPGASSSHSDAILGASRSHPHVDPATSRSHTDAVRGPFRKLTDAIPGTSRRHTEEIAKTSGIHSETAAIIITAPETSRSVIEATAGTSRSQTKANLENFKGLSEAIERTARSETVLIGGSSRRSSAEVIPGNSKHHTDETAGTARSPRESRSPVTDRILAAIDSFLEVPTSKSRMKSGVRRNSANNTEIVNTDNPSRNAQQCAVIAKATAPGMLRNNTETVSSGSSQVTGTVAPEATRNQSEDMLAISQSNSKSVRSAIPSVVATSVLGTLRNHIEPVAPRTSKNPTEMKRIVFVADRETLRLDQQPSNVNVSTSGDVIRQKESTNINQRETNINASKNGDVNNGITEKERNTESSLKRNHTNSERDNPKRPRVDEKYCTQHEIKQNKENYEHKIRDVYKWNDNLNTNEAQAGKEATKKKAADAKETTATSSESTPNGHVKQKNTNSSLTKITDIDILRNQAGAKTARSESTPNRYIEQGSAISSLHKITNIDKDNKSTDARKRKTTELLNGCTEKTVTNSTPNKIADAGKVKIAEVVEKRKAQKEMDKPDATPKSDIEKAISNSIPVKTAEIHKENKSVDGNKRQQTTKHSTPNEHIECAITNSTLTNDKQAANTKFSSFSTVPRSDFMRNQGIEETISNSAITKKSDKNKAKDPMNGKKRKVSSVDFGSQNTFSTIDLTGNDMDEPKAPTSPFKKSSPWPAKDKKINKDEIIIDISEDTCFYNLSEENDQSMNVVQEPAPKSEHQVLKYQQVIDVDEDTCLYDLIQEEITITNSGPKPGNRDQILKDQPVIDISEDTCLYEVSQQGASVAMKQSPNIECDEELKNVEQATNNTNVINEICGSEGQNVSATRLESTKNNNDSSKLLEKLEVKCAENLLAANINKEEASKNPGSSNNVVVSSFFHAPPNESQNNQKSNHKSSEQKPTHINQRLQDTCKKISLKKRHDEVNHASKRPYDKSKCKEKKLDSNTIVAACVATSSSVIAKQQKHKTVQPSSVMHPSKAPVIRPEISISMRPTPNRSLTEAAISSYIQQAVEMATPNISITTSTKSSEYRPPTMEPPLKKLRSVTKKALKRPSTDLESSKRDASKPEGQLTHPTQMNSHILPVLLPSDRSEISGNSAPRQKIAQLDCNLSELHSSNVTGNPSPKHNHTESRPGKPKPVRTAAKRHSSDSGFTKRDSHAEPRDQNLQTDQAVPLPTFSETNSARQQSPQVSRPDSSASKITLPESRPEEPNPVKTSKRPSRDPRPSPQRRPPYPIQNGQNDQTPATSEWIPARLTELKQSQHRPSEKTGSLSNHFDFATRQPTNPKVPKPMPHAALGSPKLASSPPQIHSARGKDSDSNRRETNFNNVQSPQIDWYKPVPLENLTLNRNIRNLNNVSKVHSNQKSSTKYDSHPISWHTPILPGNETPDLPQTVTSKPSSRVPNLQEPAYQGIPPGRPLEDPVRDLNPPLHPLLVLKNQAALMDYQRAPVATQPTWHIPTVAPDV